MDAVAVTAGFAVLAILISLLGLIQVEGERRIGVTSCVFVDERGLFASMAQVFVSVGVATGALGMVAGYLQILGGL